MSQPIERTSKARSHPRFFYGWVIVASSILTNSMLSASYFQGFSVLFLPIESTFGWQRSVISSALSMRQLESGVASPLIGFLMGKITPRRVIFLSGTVMGLGLFGLGFSHGYLTFFLFFFIASLGAAGASHAVTWPVLVARWFRRKRGLAIGLATMGPIVGTPFLLLNTSFEEHFGWRWVLWVYGAIVFFGVALISLLVRNSPEEQGLYPDGDRYEGEEQIATAKSRAMADSGLSLHQVLHTREFWLLLTFMGGTFIVNSAIQAHQIPYFEEDRGFSPTMAALSVTMVFWVSAAGRIGGGYLMDRYDYRFVLVGIGLLMGLSILYLQIEQPATIWGAIPFALLFGVGFGSMIPIRGTLGSLMFGLKSIGPVVGLLQGGSVAAGVVGPIFLGVMKDLDGNYHTAMWGLMIVSFLMAPVAFAMASPRTLRERKSHASDSA